MVIFTKFVRNYYMQLSQRENKKAEKKTLQTSGKLHIYYRTSDKGYPKEKPDFINNDHCLINALTMLPPSKVDWHILCDNCSEDSLERIKKIWKDFNCKPENLKTAQIGHGAGTFRMVYEEALSLPDNDLVYFLENDYLHTDEAYDSIINAFEKLNNNIDYLTLYDHPDKYRKGYVFSHPYNKFCKLFFDDKRVWQRVPSTTMTFCAMVKTLKKDKKVFWNYTNTKHPYDLEIFINLLLKHRVLVSPIPSISTHGETEFLAHGVKWEEL